MICIIDFHDSFTWNIASTIDSMNQQVRVVDWEYIQDTHLRSNEKLILGPGPGHPREYKEIKSWLYKQLRRRPVMGICLGHQILCQMHSMIVEESKKAAHGVNQSITLPDWNVFGEYKNKTIDVQRYNSLSVYIDKPLYNIDVLDINGEVWMAQARSWISYQFHPESVGTTCPKAFFQGFIAH